MPNETRVRQTLGRHLHSPLRARQLTEVRFRKRLLPLPSGLLDREHRDSTSRQAAARLYGVAWVIPFVPKAGRSVARSRTRCQWKTLQQPTSALQAGGRCLGRVPISRSEHESPLPRTQGPLPKLQALADLPPSVTATCNAPTGHG
jgi:hypothetical protein